MTADEIRATMTREKAADDMFARWGVPAIISEDLDPLFGPRAWDSLCDALRREAYAPEHYFVGTVYGRRRRVEVHAICTASAVYVGLPGATGAPEGEE